MDQEIFYGGDQPAWYRRSMRLQLGDMSGPALGDVAGSLLAVQPIGAVEHHGPHLPLVTDALIAEAVATAAAQSCPELPIGLLPVLSYALSSEHRWAPGTISLEVTTLLAVLDDLGASLARAGVRRLLFVNGHGGNSALLRVACREIRVRHGLLTFLAHPHVPVDQGGAGGDALEGGFAVHGSAGETSMVLHLRPDLVHLELARRSIPTWLGEFHHVGFGKEVSFGWTSRDIMPSGVVGDPTAASPETGKVLFEASVARLAEAMAEIAGFAFPGR